MKVSNVGKELQLT